MFNNIGGKIKILAKIICWFGIALSLIFGILMIAAGNNTTMTYNGQNVQTSGLVAGIVTIVIGCLGSWIGSFFAYGFGELIENTEAIRKNTEYKG